MTNKTLAGIKKSIQRIKAELAAIEAMRPPHNDDAQLRWNACAR